MDSAVRVDFSCKSLYFCLPNRKAVTNRLRRLCCRTSFPLSYTYTSVSHQPCIAFQSQFHPVICPTKHDILMIFVIGEIQRVQKVCLAGAKMAYSSGDNISTLSIVIFVVARLRGCRRSVGWSRDGLWFRRT